MSKIRNPILFSQYFGVPSQTLSASNLLDPFVNVDTQVFVDPVLLEKSSFKIISEDGVEAFRSHFQNLVDLLSASQSRNDIAWRTAKRLLDLREPPENGLGYGSSGRSGSSRPERVRVAVLETAKEIVDLGFKNPELVMLLGLLEEDVGPDTISDFTTVAISEQLCALTEIFCRENNIQTEKNDISENHELPFYKHASGIQNPLVLVPSDIVRDLPMANDWTDVEKAAFENAQIRNRVNSLLSGIIKPTIADRKYALRRVALSDPKLFSLVLESVKENSDFYDPNIDALGYLALKRILSSDPGKFITEQRYDIQKGPDEIMRIVSECISIFKHHIENGNLWEELWIGDKPKKERAAQLIFFAISDCFCKANNIDISPEANMGGGPVDFKFSKTYASRVVVELKRSGGQVIHGYEKQLEIYKSASRTENGIFVVIDYGDGDSKIQRIFEIQRSRIKRGDPASSIVVIDASKKASASKRK